MPSLEQRCARALMQSTGSQSGKCMTLLKRLARPGLIFSNIASMGVEKELAQLEKMGWVESEKIDNSLEPKVYFVSAKAFQLLRFPKKNQILSVSV